MKPGFLSSLILVWVFSLSIFLPHHLAAAENKKSSLNLHKFDHLFGSVSESTKNPELASARLSLMKLRKDLDSKGITSMGSVLDKLRDKILVKANEAIDEHGAQRFHEMVQDITGQSILSDLPEGASDQVLSSVLMREISSNCDQVAAAFENSTKDEIKDVLTGAESIVGELENGASDEELAEKLQKHAGKGKSAIKKVFKVLMAVFMCAAVGAIGLVSLGFLSAAVAGGSILLSAVGGGVTIACIVGIFKYIKEAVAVFKKQPAEETKGSTTLRIVLPEQYLVLPGGAY